jgi:hypothetical protein
MNQISPPIRILLVCAIGVLAAYMLFLRPKGAEVEPPPATTTAPAASAPASAPGKAAKTAHDAAQTQADASAAHAGEAATTASATAPATGSATQAPSGQAAAVPALDRKALATLPADVREAVQARKVIVLGVLNLAARPWRPMADDDRAVRNALRDADTYGGKVFIKAVGIGELASYRRLVQEVNVNQSPTVVVIDRNRRAEALTGYVDRVSINQAIVDARRASISPRIKDPFLRRFNAACGRYFFRTRYLSAPTVRGAEVAAIRRGARMLGRIRQGFVRLAAPARWRTLKARTVTALAAEERALSRIAGSVARKDAAGVNAALAATASLEARSRALEPLFEAAGVTNCTAARRR